MSEDQEDFPWYRPLLVGVGALLGVAVLVGGLIGVVALGAANVAGLGSGGDAAEEKPSLYIPPRTGDPDDGDEGPGLTLKDLNGGVDPTRTETPSPTPTSPASKRPKPKPARSVISLSASPLEAAPMERIYLSGTYPGGEGVSLQVQRYDGGWVDFPTSASVSGQTFSTYVMTGQVGRNRFRVVDPATGKRSNVVTVRVH